MRRGSRTLTAIKESSAEHVSSLFAEAKVKLDSVNQEEKDKLDTLKHEAAKKQKRYCC